MSKKSKKSRKDEPILKPHQYDGIQEYDQRLPNWWLFTLYGAIVFSVLYWILHHQTDVMGTDQQKVELAMQGVERARLASAFDVTDDNIFMEMSRNDAVLELGKATYTTQCMACHGPDLKGGIGFNLVDDEWIHGARPSEMHQTITNGILEKGMIAFGPLLGPQKIGEVVAYIISQQPDGSTLE